MVDIGKGAGLRTVAVITDMDRPLGNTVGNALEVMEAIEVLSENGPDDITEVCIVLAGKCLSWPEGSFDECRTLAGEAIKDGRAYGSLRK